MTCKDCIHYFVCSAGGGLFNEKDESKEMLCNHFKSKSRYVELPCGAGDTVYPLNADRRFRAFIERIEILSKGLGFEWVQYDVGVDTAERWDDGFFTVDDIGKTVFLDETEYLIALKEQGINESQNKLTFEKDGKQ